MCRSMVDIQCPTAEIRRGKKGRTRMWANAQRDGLPVKHRWRPVFNAAKLGWRWLLNWLPCSNAAKSRKPLKLAWVPQTNETISAASGPKFAIWCGHVEKILLLNKVFPIVDIWLSCKDNSTTNLCDGAQMANFWRFFASCTLSEPRAAYFRPAFLIRTKATPCAEVW